MGKHNKTPLVMILLLTLLAGMIISRPLSRTALNSVAYAETTAQETLQGYVNFLYGDPEPGSAEPGKAFVFLTDSNGDIIAELDAPPWAANPYRGQRVEVTGQILPQTGGEAPLLIREPAFELAPGVSPQDAQPVTGTRPYIMVLCQFPDVAGTPRTPAEYTPLYANAYPGLDHYFRQLSRDAVNLTGTTVTTQWFTTTNTQAYYQTLAETNNQQALVELANDCANAANPTVNFAPYVGINFGFNSGWDCCAWGGGVYLTLDGPQRLFSTTWLPPWAQTYEFLGHEMGHSMGMPHSSGPSWNPYTGLSIYVSDWDVMSRAGGTRAVAGPPFGYPGQGTIAENLDLAGWMPANRIVNVPVGSSALVELDRLTVSPTTTDPLMVKLPMGGSATRFYTVEARFLVNGLQNYDQNIPANAVLIYDVDTVNRNGNALNHGPALIVDDDTNRNLNDAGAMWLPGETFSDTTNKIGVYVVSNTTNTYTVAVVNNAKNTLSNPADFATVGATSVTLSWTTLTGATGYDLQVATDANFTTNLQSFNDLAGTSQLITNLSNTTYYWRTRAKFGTFATDWNTARRFTVNGAPPSAPTLYFPLPNSSNTSGKPTFLWESITGAVRYELEYGGLLNRYTINVVGTSYVLPSPLAPGIYYWRVRAFNNADVASEWSMDWSFTVTSAAGVAPSRNYFTTNTALLTWYGVTWATGYEVQVDNSIAFATLEFSTNALPGNATSVTTSALPDGLYYWRVRAKRTDGTWGVWSATESFTIASASG